MENQAAEIDVGVTERVYRASHPVVSLFGSEFLPR